MIQNEPFPTWYYCQIPSRTTVRMKLPAQRPHFGNAGRLRGLNRGRRSWSSARGHVGGEDVVRVAVQVLAGSAVTHRGLRSRRAAAGGEWQRRSIRTPRLLSRIGPPVPLPMDRSMARPAAGGSGIRTILEPCRTPAAPDGHAPRQDRRCPRRWPRRSAGRATRAWLPARSRTGSVTGGPW